MRILRSTKTHSCEEGEAVGGRRRGRAGRRQSLLLHKLRTVGQETIKRLEKVRKYQAQIFFLANPGNHDLDHN